MKRGEFLRPTFVKIYLGSDHAGFLLKQKVKKYLDRKKIAYEDLGDFVKNRDDDYPDFVVPVARRVARDKNARGIVIGGSGQGEAIAANRMREVRAAVYYGGDLNTVQLSREHNNANVLSLGARFLTEKEALRAIELWLKSSFKGGRHARRMRKIDQLYQ